jgi:hypothetical protein
MVSDTYVTLKPLVLLAYMRARISYQHHFLVLAISTLKDLTICVGCRVYVTG